MPLNLERLRNIGIAAHIDAGKTTTTERILYYAGMTHKMGEVDDGTAVTDFDVEEQQRGITIYSAAVSCPWRDYTINLIDTPGHVDFTAEVERSLRVLDGMVAVFDAKEGVEAQSETVWRQASKYRVPKLCFMNKMDKVGADFGASLESIRDRLEARPVAVQIPIGAESLFEGLIDLLAMKAVYYQREHLGSRYEERPIPPELEEVARAARHRLEEQIAETSEELMARFIHDEPIPVEQLRAGLRAATIGDKLHPVFCGSALQYIGVQRLLDGVVDYLPSPLDLPPVTGSVPGRRAPHPEVACPCDPRAPLVAYLFKIVAEKPMDACFVRVYSGTLKAGSRVYNPGRDCKENISRMYRVFAKKRERAEQAGPGDIVVVTGLKASLTGDTLCDARHPVLLERIEFPETVISRSIEPESSADRDRLIEALAMLGRENPTFGCQMNVETGQMLISGMGELHLEVLVNRLRRDLRVPVRVGQPRVSYRETVCSAGEAEKECHQPAGAGRGQYAKVRLRVEPFTPQPGQENLRFQNRVPEGHIRKAFIKAIEEGIRSSARSGVLAGYPMINVQVTLLDAEEHEEDSSEVAFEAAGARAFDEAVRAADPALMEPIMGVQIVTPEAYLGPISGDLSRRRGVVNGSTPRGGRRILDVAVPLKEMFGYATDLRSLTQGRAVWTMEPSHYALVPPQVANVILGLT